MLEKILGAYGHSNLPFFLSYEYIKQYYPSLTTIPPPLAYNTSLSKPIPCPPFLSLAEMRFLTASSILLITSSTLAAPFANVQQARNEKRAANRHTNPFNLASTPANTSDILISESAGATLSGTGFTSVTGTFTTPNEGSGSLWVGIDGETCATAALQTGVDWTHSGSSVTYDAWYEWYPDYAYDFSIAIAAGDSIKITVTATSTTAGTAVIENISTGTTITHRFSGEPALCGYNAEWIVEGETDFGKVTFTSCSATENGMSIFRADYFLVQTPSTVFRNFKMRPVHTD